MTGELHGNISLIEKSQTIRGFREIKDVMLMIN